MVKQTKSEKRSLDENHNIPQLPLVNIFPNTREGNNEKRSWRRKFNNRDKDINPVGRPKGSGGSKKGGQPREFVCRGCSKVVPTREELKEHQEEWECE